MAGAGARWISLAGSILFAGMLASCTGASRDPATEAGDTVATAESLPAGPGFPAGGGARFPVLRASGPATGPACYVLDSINVWRHATGEREATCFQRDNCSGELGRNLNDRTCLKWAMGPDEPALPWSESLTNPKLAADIPPPQDIYEGSYEMTSDCHEKGCAYGSVRLAVDTPVYSRTDTRAAIVVTVPKGECIDTETDKLLSVPARGVVLESNDRFTAGDVIYVTNYDGEGFSTVWKRGEYLHEFQDEVVVRWDDAPTDPRAGYWIQVRRANGQSGWIRDAGIAERRCNPARQ